MKLLSMSTNTGENMRTTVVGSDARSEIQSRRRSIRTRQRLNDTETLDRLKISWKNTTCAVSDIRGKLSVRIIERDLSSNFESMAPQNTLINKKLRNSTTSYTRGTNCRR
ncbi:hypothetical protein PUN28_004709 [Cardiocondyla obscurior]|uniref:Uncharacterized protein n=1 Tax=Cardiocondyla obscurior TaxID=286306 RepID=A0AAW2GC84_9HYME